MTALVLPSLPELMATAYHEMTEEQHQAMEEMEQAHIRIVAANVGRVVMDKMSIYIADREREIINHFAAALTHMETRVAAFQARWKVGPCMYQVKAFSDSF